MLLAISRLTLILVPLSQHEFFFRKIAIVSDVMKVMVISFQTLGAATESMFTQVKFCFRHNKLL